VVGSGVSNVPALPINFDIDAHSGPSGENPTGTVSFVPPSLPNLRIAGPVTCVRVAGNQAVIGTDNSQGNTATFGTADFIQVLDGTPDLLGIFVPAPGTSAAACPAPDTQSALPLLSGNLVVTDAPALPTSINQCRNDGWRTYGFKSQGRCVAFVIKTKICDALERHHIKPPGCPPEPPKP
jgi:hypothetical protein